MNSRNMMNEFFPHRSERFFFVRKVNAEDKKAVAEKPHRDGREYCARLDGYGKISDEMQ